ncbi:MAG: glutamine-hydrolyzing carbamoyl-phosphate synthase small subunit [Candidatus Eremiobacterota bacterium]
MKGMLLLEDGSAWEGVLFGHPSSSLEGPSPHGELVFNTAMSGYEEILTDPSYRRQTVVFTNPQMGNYGITLEDAESRRPWVEAVVVREPSLIPSNWRSRASLDAYLKEHKIPGLCEVDTRGLVRHIRQHGAMRCIVAPYQEPHSLLEAVRAQPSMEGWGLAYDVTCEKPWELDGTGPRVAVLDLGVKRGILRELHQRGLNLRVFPASTAARDVLAWNPAGLVLSNGPGDPAALKDIIAEVKPLVTSGLPVLAICLGHQLTALALGAKTFKLKFGHRGGNHPVKGPTGKVEISSHNHGFAVDPESLPRELETTHFDLYDGTLEGFRHRELPVQCVQYHPESAPGPRDSLYLFEDFITEVSRPCHSVAT